MKVLGEYFDNLFEFDGLWGIPSKCGLKLIQRENCTIVLVTELYKENPGSTITAATVLLINQIKDRFNLDPHKIIYIECSPNMNSKLSFYDEEFYLVKFDIDSGVFTNPQWAILTKEQASKLLATK